MATKNRGISASKMDGHYEGMPVKRRMELAIEAVLDRGQQQKTTAEKYGVSQSQLNRRVQAERKNREALAKQSKRAAVAKAGVGNAPAIDPLGINERRRVPPFWEFEQKYFGHLTCFDCGIRHEPAEFHREIVDVLGERHPRTLINCPPGFSKSTLVTVKHTLYRIIEDPNSLHLIVSKGLPLAKTFLESLNQMMTNPELYDGAGGNLIADFGPFKTGSSIWNSQQIYVAGRITAEKDPTVQVLGVGGQIYGRRATDIKCDDIADVENQKNPERVRSMLTWLDREVFSRVGRQSGAVSMIGTRVHPGDIYSFLSQRPSYKVVKYPAILDENLGLSLWPEHVSIDSLLAIKDEMSAADFQLIYQQVDVPGAGASFTEEAINACKNNTRVSGQWDPGCKLIAGLDLAGGTSTSGYTAAVLIAIDTRTGRRFLVDNWNVKGMKAPELRDAIFDWTNRYPIYEWRVEANGLQRQLVQYNEEIVRALANRGVRITGHITGKNKWDEQFGVESMAPLFNAEMIDLPWGNLVTSKAWQPLVEQLVAFPMGQTSDLVMAFWFAELGCRDILQRSALPLFDRRMKVPQRIQNKRHVVDFRSRQVRKTGLHSDAVGAMSWGQANYRRMMLGEPHPHGQEPEEEVPELTRFINVPGHVEDEWDPSQIDFVEFEEAL